MTWVHDAELGSNSFLAACYGLLGLYACVAKWGRTHPPTPMIQRFCNVLILGCFLRAVYLGCVPSAAHVLVVARVRAVDHRRRPWFCERIGVHSIPDRVYGGSYTPGKNPTLWSRTWCVAAVTFLVFSRARVTPPPLHRAGATCSFNSSSSPSETPRSSSSTCSLCTFGRRCVSCL